MIKPNLYRYVLCSSFYVQKIQLGIFLLPTRLIVYHNAVKCINDHRISLLCHYMEQIKYVKFEVYRIGRCRHEKAFSIIKTMQTALCIKWVGGEK